MVRGNLENLLTDVSGDENGDGINREVWPQAR